jgi:hypothetical protein
MNGETRAGFIFCLVAIFGAVITMMAGISETAKLILAAIWVFWFALGVILLINNGGEKSE